MEFRFACGVGLGWRLLATPVCFRLLGVLRSGCCWVLICVGLCCVLVFVDAVWVVVYCVMICSLIVLAFVSILCRGNYLFWVWFRGLCIGV